MYNGMYWVKYARWKTINTKKGQVYYWKMLCSLWHWKTIWTQTVLEEEGKEITKLKSLWVLKAVLSLHRITRYSLKTRNTFFGKQKVLVISWIISYTIGMELCYHTLFRLPILLPQITPSSSKCPIMHHKFSLQIHCVTFFPSLFSIWYL